MSMGPSDGNVFLCFVYVFVPLGAFSVFLLNPVCFLSLFNAAPADGG